MSIKNLPKRIYPYMCEIVIVCTALVILGGLVGAAERGHCADGIPLTDFQAVQFYMYMLFILFGIFTLINAAQSRTTANEIKEMMQTEKELLE